MSRPTAASPGLAWRGLLEDLPADLRTRLMDRSAPDDPEVRDTVRDLLADVRTRGDEALRDMARRFDGVDLDGSDGELDGPDVELDGPEVDREEGDGRERSTLEVPRAQWDEALEAMDPPLRRALERAARNIETFHRTQIPADLRVETEPGVVLGRRFVPLDTVGVYAPGGRAAYPSSVLMGVVPARAAGVREVVVCSPPGPEGRPPAEVLAAAALGGATRLFAAGGAGAVGAMAFGTDSVPRCDAVVGPGNRWVLEAKRQVAGEVRVDSPAGPSEVLVLADASADPARTAAELVAQAEHDPDAAVLLVTDAPDLLDAVVAELARQVAATPRRNVVEEALARRGALLLAPSPEAARAFARDWAPEHLCLYTSDPEADMTSIPTAGTVFLGQAASVVHGDYLTGANHVLPTAGAARTFSGLSTLDFLRSYTWQDVAPGAAADLAGDAARLARSEGLPAHATAAMLRSQNPAPPADTLRRDTRPDSRAEEDDS